MKQLFKKWFTKNETDVSQLPIAEKDAFVIKLDDLTLGILECSNGEWSFQYTDDYKQHQNEYNHIVGFSNPDKVYYSDALWPFFQIRIPGLKQPAIQEILQQENIDAHNEAALLRRFGKKSIANPYELVPA